MRRAIFFSIALGLLAVCLWGIRATPLGVGFRIPSVFAQAIYQQKCSSPFIPITGIGWQASNLTNDQLIQWGCLDNTGNLMIGNRIYAAVGSNPQASYNNLPSSGGTIYLGQGTYQGSILLQSNKSVRLIGAGKSISILSPSAANTPAIQGPQSGSAVDNAFFSGFTVKANASGSTGPAIDLSGLRHSTFEDIEYLSNAGSNFNSFFHFSASPGLCYGNVILRPYIDSQSGPSTVFLFDNGGTSNALNNANQTVIRDIWINSNTGIATIADARRSSNTIFEGGLVENNTGAVVLIPGSNGAWNHIWMESNAATSIVGTSGADGSSNASQFIGNQISTAQTWTLQSGNTNNIILNNWPDSNLTITDNSGGGTNNLIQAGALTRSSQADYCFHLKNTGTNGVDWALCSVTGSGSIGVTGGWALRDFTNSKNGITFSPNGGAAIFSGAVQFGTFTFATLPSSPNGTQVFCSDCNATCAAGASTGRMCSRENGAWVGF